MKALRFSTIVCVLAAAFFFRGSQTFGQSGSLPDSFNRVRYLNQLFAQQAAKGMQKTTGTNERLVAQSVYELNGQGNSDIRDSAVFSYSGEHGSTYDHNRMGYYYDLFLDFQYFDLPYDFSRIDVRADTMSFWSRPAFSSSPLMLAETYGAAYHPNERLQAYRKHSFVNNQSMGTDKYAFHYSSGGNLDYIDKEEAGSGQQTRFAYYHDVQGRVDRDTAFVGLGTAWLPVYTNKYIYNAAGLVDQIETYVNMGAGWQPERRLEHEYDAAGRLKKFSYFANTGFGLALVGMDSFGYTGNLPFFTFALTVTTSSAYRIEKSLNAQSLPDTINFYNYQNNDWVPEFLFSLEYNVSGNPTVMRRYAAAQQPVQQDRQHHFYYETYQTTPVEDIHKERFTVHPNPAHREFFISGEATSSSEVLITDLAGRVMKRVSLPSGSMAHRIDIEGLVPGYYLVQISTPDQKKRSVHRLIRQ